MKVNPVVSKMNTNKVSKANTQPLKKAAKPAVPAHKGKLSVKA